MKIAWKIHESNFTMASSLKIEQVVDLDKEEGEYVGIRINIVNLNGFVVEL